MDGWMDPTSCLKTEVFVEGTCSLRLSLAVGSLQSSGWQRPHRALSQGVRGGGLLFQYPKPHLTNIPQ